MTLTQEKAKEEDLILLFQLNKDLIDRYEDTAAIDYERVLSWLKQNLKDSLPRFRRILADGELAGYYCLIPSEPQWELDSLFVFPPFQSKGIGSHILTQCIQEASGNLFFYVFRANHKAIALYQRMGFSVCKEVGKTRYIMEYHKKAV